MVHTPTLLLVNALVMATLAICLGLVAQRGQRDGLRIWAGALAAHSGAYFLFGLRGVASDWLTVWLANVLLAASFALMLEGLHQFQQVAVRRLLVWASVLAAALFFALFLDDPPLRLLLGSTLSCLQLLQLNRQLGARWQQTAGRGKYFVQIAFVLVALMLALRAAAVLVGVTQFTSVKDSNLIQAATFLMATVAMMLANLGMVVMTKERADECNRTLALVDALTGLYNRRHIQQSLTQQIARARRQHLPLSLLMLDIDHFKHVNDSHGHQSGDKVLRDLATCIKERVRTQDTVGRWGGEEFIVLLPDTDAAGAEALAEQLRQAVERWRFVSLQAQPIPLTISIGVHALAEGEGSDELVGVADRALYLAKQHGRNRVEQL